MTCLHRFDVSLLCPAGPGLWQCLDTGPCWDRQDAIGPQSESIELAVSAHEAAQGAARRAQPVLSSGDATDIRPRTGELISSGKGAKP